jgi:hypothetical protein
VTGLLNAKQLRERLGLPASTFFLRKKQGALRKFEVRQPMGRYRYSAELVELYLAGRSTVRIGAGARRAS